MNTEKFSKLIVELRKEKKMTQQELANKLFVTDKAISKWERGLSLPDVTMLDSIAKEFGLSVAELINGERIKAKDPKQIEEIFVKSMKEQDKKSKKRKKIITLLIIIIISLISMFMMIFSYNNYDNVLAYTFKGESNHFAFDSGNVVYSKQNNVLTMTNFRIKDEYSSLPIKTLKISIYFDEKDWGYFMFDESDLNNKSINELLSTISFYEFGKSSKCVTNCSSDSFMDSNKNDFPNNLEIVVDYCTLSNSCESEKFHIVSEIVASNKIINSTNK